MCMLGRIVCLYVDLRKAGATAEAAASSPLPSSGFWPASPNVSHCLSDVKKIMIMKNESERGGRKTGQ